MKTKTLVLAFTILLGLGTACTDKKKTSQKPETEAQLDEQKTAVENTVNKDEKRRLDSIRQVKEHGHAH